jgi:hypothetical protein
MRALRFFLMLVAATSASAADLEIEDRGNFIPSARLSFDIAPRGFEAPSKPKSGHGIEVGISGASGEDRQSLRAGDSPVVFGNRTFFGATELKHEFDWRFLEVAYRFRHFFNPVFAIEALGGLGFAELEITTTSPSASANEKLSDGGLVGGFGILWQFQPNVGLQSRITVFGSGREEGVTAAARFDVNVAWAFARNAALRAGLVSWAVGSSRSDADGGFSGKSPIGAAFSGIGLGLDVMF